MESVFTSDSWFAPECSEEELARMDILHAETDRPIFMKKGKGK